jgi:hypothetical protein
MYLWWSLVPRVAVRLCGLAMWLALAWAAVAAQAGVQWRSHSRPLPDVG